MAVVERSIMLSPGEGETVSLGEVSCSHGW
jgi:hypothetical protein